MATEHIEPGLNGVPYQFAEAYSKSVPSGAPTRIVRVALYTRVSTPYQMLGEFSAMQKQHYGLQSAVAQKANLGWRITHDFSDGAKSGTKRNRKKINEARKVALAGEFDVLLVGAQARIARDVCFSMEFIADLDRMGIQIWTVDGRQISTKGDNFMITGFTAVMDQAESIRIGDRIVTAMARRAARGLFGGGPPPIGYIYVPLQKGQIMPGPGNDDAKELITRSAEGESVAELEADFSRRGIVQPSTVVCRGKPNERTIRGKPYTRATIVRLIRDVIYFGCVGYRNWKRFSEVLPQPKCFINGVAIYPGAHQPTVTEETWRKANANLDGRPKLERKPKTADVEGHCFVQGLAECKCGARLTPKFVGKATAENRRNYLICMSQISSNRRPTNPCSMPCVPAAAIDDCVVSYLSSLFKHPELLSAGLEGPQQAEDMGLADLQAELSAVRVRINECSQLFSEVKLTARETMAAQIRALSEREADLQRRIRVHGTPVPRPTEAQKATIEELERVARALDAAPRCEIKRLVKIWIAKVRVEHATEKGSHLRRFVVTLDLRFTTLPGAAPHVFTIEETAGRSGKYHIVAPFVQDVAGTAVKGVSTNSPCYPLVLLEKWKKQLANGGVTQKQIASQEGVSEGYVSNVVHFAVIPRLLRDRILRADHSATGYNWLKRLASCPVAEMDWEVSRLLNGPTPRRRPSLKDTGGTIDLNQKESLGSPGAKVAS